VIRLYPGKTPDFGRVPPFSERKWRDYLRDGAGFSPGRHFGKRKTPCPARDKACRYSVCGQHQSRSAMRCLVDLDDQVAVIAISRVVDVTFAAFATANIVLVHLLDIEGG
jgi:hypothetical protein